MENFTLQHFTDAQNNLKDIARHTELVPSHYLSIPDKREVLLKTECLQHTGSFKLRGAYNRISRLNAEEKQKGVIASSAGNHAQGVAYAATKTGVRSTIVMPRNAPLPKVEATRYYGAQVILHGSVYDEAYAEACKLQQETDAIFIHPFNDPDVIIGQGTIGLEIIEDCPDIDTIVVPIGGGGLAAGISAAVKLTNPRIRVIGVEAANAACMQRSFQAGHPVTLDNVHTMADGIAVKTPGDLTFKLCQKYLDDVVTVSEEELSVGVLTLLEKRKLLSEGAGAAALAAVLFEKFKTSGKIACVVSGGNIDVTTLQLTINSGLRKLDRMTLLSVNLKNQSGQLAKLMDIIAKNGAQLYYLNDNNKSLFTDVMYKPIDIFLNTYDSKHIQQIRQAVTDAGFELLS